MLGAARQGSSESYLQFFETYARGEDDEMNMNPRQKGDFRERVPRETIFGRYAIFHETIEMYLYRQWRAYTCPRVAVFWFGSFALMQHGCHAFNMAFPNIQHYGSLSKHPNYKMLGPVYSYFYAARGIFCIYVFARMTRFQYYMIKRHWLGYDDPHYFWYYDTLYPDMVLDEDDMKPVNFRYTDQKVSPDAMTGYYPYANMRYGKFLNEKKDITYRDLKSIPFQSNVE